MSIFINLEHITPQIKMKILREIESDFFPNDNDKTNYYRLIYNSSSIREETHQSPSNDPELVKGVELLEESINIDLIKTKLKEMLTRISEPGYVVTTDDSSAQTIVFLDRTKAESIGILHCRHCGMEFEDEMQLGNHLRVHYNI